MQALPAVFRSLSTVFTPSTELPGLPKRVDPKNVASDQDLDCLPLIQQFLNTSACIQMDFSKFFDM